MTNFHSSVERMNSVFVLFCGFLVTSQAQYLGNETKSCSHHCINTEVNLTNEKLEGIWYLQYSIPHFFEVGMKCAVLNISQLGDKHLYYDKIEFNNETDEPRETFGTIEYSEDGFTVFFATELELPFDYETIELTADFWVLTICNECGFFEKHGAGTYAYIFTKLQYPSCEVMEGAITALEHCDIPRKALTLHEQNDCPYC